MVRRRRGAAGSEPRRLRAEGERLRVFVNAVDDPANASVYLGGVVRRGGVTFGISTDGAAPALAGLLREALDAMLPADLESGASARTSCGSPGGPAVYRWRRGAPSCSRR